MSTKECTNDKTRKIIEEDRKYPESFDKAHSDYKDKHVADNIWQNIAATTGIEGKYLSCYLSNILRLHF